MAEFNNKNKAEMVELVDTSQFNNEIRNHKHTGTDSNKISIKDIGNLIEVVDFIPTHTPKSMFDQIKLYISGGSNSLYIYETTNKTWRYINLR